jgi:lipid A 3-O-deacylase
VNTVIRKALCALIGSMSVISQLHAADKLEDYCNGGSEEYQPPHHGWYVTWENDVVGIIPSDKYYTQGAQAGYTYKNSDLPSWVNRANSWLCKTLRFATSGDGRAKALSSSALFLGQQLFTPRDTTRIDPIPDDRPYAGWLYAGGRIDLVQALEMSPLGHRRWRTHTFELQLGVVGARAFGMQTQQQFHDLSNDTAQSNGWDHQLDNRFGAQGFYNYSTRLTSFKVGSLIGDVLFGASAAIGNLQIYGEGGATLRIGRNMGPLAQRAIVPTISTMTMQPLPVDSSGAVSVETNQRRERLSQSDDAQSCKYLGAIECYVFIGMAGRGIAKNEFLEPASSGAGSAIHRESFVYDLSYGARIRYEKFRIDYISTTRSREFSPGPANPLQNEGRHDFGSLTVSCYGSFGGYDGYWQFVCPTFVGAMVGFLAFR